MMVAKSKRKRGRSKGAPAPRTEIAPPAAGWRGPNGEEVLSADPIPNRQPSIVGPLVVVGLGLLAAYLGSRPAPPPPPPPKTPEQRDRETIWGLDSSSGGTTWTEGR